MDHHVVTNAELEQARRDPAFRKQLIASSLDHLLIALARLRACENHNDPLPAQQIREGVQLAMKLTEMLQPHAKRTDDAA